MRPDVLVAGHVVQDLDPNPASDAWRLGGAAAYAALLARNLGLRTAVLTSCDDAMPVESLLQDVEVKRVPALESTKMRNVYTTEGRQQWMPAHAATLTDGDVPDGWRDAPVVLLGPVAGELDASLAGAFSAGSLVGLGLQGLLRTVGVDGRVRPAYPVSPEVAPLIERANALFLSDEDIPRSGAKAALAGWSRRTEIVAFTRGYRGAEVSYRGEWRHIGAFPAHAVDPTGAGDVFAVAFLIRFGDSGDAWEAARFASCAASLVIEGPGVDAVPGRAEIEERLAAHPEVGVV